jgi:hypothetical protein
MTSTSARPSRAALAASALLGAVILTITVAGCTKGSLPGDLKVADVTTGRTVGPDGKILDDARTSMFWTTDTFYVEVATEGSADDVNLQARWTGPDGAVAAESSKTISPKGPIVTSLEAAPPKDKEGRWPAGDYKLEILVNGSSQVTRDLNTR